MGHPAPLYPRNIFKMVASPKNPTIAQRELGELIDKWQQRNGSTHQAIEIQITEKLNFIKFVDCFKAGSLIE